MKSEGARQRGFLGPCILLLLLEVPSHGYQLIDPLKLLGFDWGGPGSVYQELHKLETAGLVRSTWEHGQGPARRVYEPTEAGRMALATFVSNAAERAECLRGLLVKAEPHGVGVGGASRWRLRSSGHVQPLADDQELIIDA